MKKFLALFSLFTLLTAFTCENEPLDDGITSDTNTNTNTNLLGDWNLIELDASISTLTNFQGQQITSDIEVYSTTVDYILNFTETNFTTNGNYSYVAEVTAIGITIPAESYTLNNVIGSGSYSVNESEMTIDGSFFEFEFQGGMDTSAFEGEQTVTFSISSDGQTLTFIQNETTTETDAATGVVTTVTTVSTSVWTR